jgi:hypothetical protein
MTQVVEYLLCHCEALSSNPNPIKKQRKGKKEKGGRERKRRKIDTFNYLRILNLVCIIEED